MKNYYIGALAVFVSSVMAYPFLESLANTQRGYSAIGGEELVPVIGAVVAGCVLQAGVDRLRGKVEVRVKNTRIK